MSGRREPADARALLDACVHCGLCLPACPTYALTGSELDAPRGRVDLVRGLLDGTLADPAVAAEHLDRCLGCRACETACPSGVRYGALLETARERLAEDRPARGAAAAALRVLASPSATLWTMRAAAAARGAGVLGILRRAPGAVGRAARLAPDARWTPWSRAAGGTIPAVAPRRGAVALLPGCVMDQAFPHVHAASARLLADAGFDVRVPRGPLCCGALHAHVGDAATADACAARLADALPADVDALVADAAGCGSRLRETPGPWRGRVADVLEFLDREGLRTPLAPVAAAFGRTTGGRLRVAYSDPCHLAHAQGVRDAPRRLLGAIPDVELVPLRDADRCCGSAGVFNLAQPELSAALLDDKVAALRDAAPDVVATANPGCHLQIAAGLRAAGLRAPVVHVVELLAAGLVARDGVIRGAAPR